MPLQQKSGQGFENVDRARGQFRELMERWDNRLTVEKLSLSEYYVNGSCALSAYYLGSSNLEYRAIMSAFCNEGVILAYDIVLNGEGQFFDVSLDYGCGEQDFSVLVDVVEFVHHPKGNIPMLACVVVDSVGLDLVNDRVGYRWSGDRYRSAFDGRFKVDQSFPKREADELFFGLPGRHCVGSMVKRSAQAVDCVTDDQRSLRGDWFRLKDQLAASGGIVVGNGPVKVGRAIPGGECLKLVDVGIGPIDL